LKPYREVKAPVPYDKKGEYKTGMAVGWGKCTMGNLLAGFGRYQNENLQAKNLIVIDQTGIKSDFLGPKELESVAVSSEEPLWRGEEAIEMARRWFEEEFGVTFTEEVRPMKVLVVQRKPQ
jgi:hypothetical protein